MIEVQIQGGPRDGELFTVAGNLDPGQHVTAGGDRFRVYQRPDGVWVGVWDGLDAPRAELVFPALDVDAVPPGEPAAEAKNRRGPTVTETLVASVFAAGLGASGAVALAAIAGAGWVAARVAEAAGGWVRLAMIGAGAFAVVTLIGGLIARKYQP